MPVVIAPAFIRDANLTNYLDISSTPSFLHSLSSPFFLHHFVNALASWLLFFYVFFPYRRKQPTAYFLPFYLQLGGAWRARGAVPFGPALGGRGRNEEAACRPGEEGAGVAVGNYLRVFDVVLTFSSQLVGLSVSNGKDQLVVFHTKDNKDLIVCLFSKEPSNDSRIGELVGVLASHFKRLVLQTHCSQIQNFPRIRVGVTLDFLSVFLHYCWDTRAVIPCVFETTLCLPLLSLYVFIRAWIFGGKCH